MMKRQVLIVNAIFAVVAAGAAQAQSWGDLTATFKIDGNAAKPKALVITKDPEVCGKHGLVDESLVVNPTNQGIENVVVYLYVNVRDPKANKKPPVHESYKESEKATVQFDNDKCRFAPHITAVRTTQTLVAGNKDAVAHNTNVQTIKNSPQNILIPSNGNLKLNLTLEEMLPIPVSCNIHPWMKAYVVVKDHPYVGISDKDGKVTIKNVPTGKWTFQFWQEASGYLAEVNFKGKTTKWERGRVELDIKAGPNDLGEIKVAPAIFKLNP